MSMAQFPPPESAEVQSPGSIATEIDRQRIPSHTAMVHPINCKRFFHLPLTAAMIAAAGMRPQPVTAAPGLALGFEEMRPSWETATPIPADVAHADREILQMAEHNARLANQAFFRSRKYIDGWLAHADPESGLIPRNLNEGKDFWNGRDAAADNYPYMVLTASMTDRPLLDGRLLDMLRAESRLTARVGRLVDDYSFSRKTWRRETLDLDATIFDSAEYVKDGLLPITEWLGRGPWAERMTGIVDDIWKHAPVETPFGNIPTLNVEVCGDLLQANSRIFWLTGDRKYLDQAIRLGDYFLLGSNHPTRDFKQLRLNDHGCEVVNGLAELYLTVSRAAPEKKKAYEEPIHAMFDTILEKGRNQDGLLYNDFEPKTGRHSDKLADTWGYVYDGFYTVWLVDRTAAYREAVLTALGNLKGKYVGMAWGEKSADAYADSIEGAINLINREPVASAADWADSQIQMMWAIQKTDGVIEGWHGDGNFARTSLMYALWKTQGVTIRPWRADVRFGAVRKGDTLHLVLTSARPWEGSVIFDTPRHATGMRLPQDYPRINQFPEWFTVSEQSHYAVKSGQEAPVARSGADLAAGITMKLAPAEFKVVEVTRK